MNSETFQKMKWLSVYGASVALQVHQKIIEGRGAPDEEDMERFKEEAAAIADLEGNVETDISLWDKNDS